MKQLFIFIAFFSTFSSLSSQNCGFKTIGTAFVDDILRGSNRVASLRSSLIIPVVVHVVRHTSDEIVSDANVFAQIDILNRDFNARNGDLQNVPIEFKDKIGNVGIQFCLVIKDSIGTAHSGIIRVRTAVKTIGLKDSLFSDKLGGSTPWNTSKYLNIWVANTGENITGLGSYPTPTPQLNEGVIIHPRYFGQNKTDKFGLGRVAVHEIGHYFGLYHTWGKTRDSLCTSDEVEDTPPQKSAYAGCPIYPQYSCNASNMFMNFMDYVDDPCMLLFTNGQKARMLATITHFRQGLLQSAACSINPNRGIDAKAYPNPARNTISVDYNLTDKFEEAYISLFDFTGREIKRQKLVVAQNQLQWETRQMQTGLYLIAIYADKHLVWQTKVSVQK
jgi:Pregnancy-associated plasma protein-A/Secretion system C-terminal sorting domain